MRSTALFVRLFGAIALVYIALAFSFVTVIAQREKAQVTETVTNDMRHVAVSLHQQLSSSTGPQSPDDIDRLVSAIAGEVQMRITIVARDGRVIADSDKDASEMENHANRPEIQDAWRTGFGNARRFSRTLDTDMLYVGIGPKPTTEDLSTTANDVDPSMDPMAGSDFVVRTSMKTSIIDQQIADIQRFVWLFAISSAAIAMVATWHFSRRALHPLKKITGAANAIAQGNYQTQIGVDRRDANWGTMATAFERMQDELILREKALIDNSRQLETVLGSMSEGVIAINRNHRIQFSNHAASQLLMLPDRDVDGRSLMEIVRLPTLRKAIDEAWESNRPIRCELEISASSPRTLLMRISRFAVDQGEGLVVVMHDVTELRQLESMRRDFAANVSHELKTPLASIKAYSETLRLGAINDSERNLEFVERIENQADRLHQLIIDLIQLSRVESSKNIFETTEVDIGPIVDQCVNFFAPLAQSRGIKLTVDVDSPIIALADFEAVRTILDNLVSNALRYTQPDDTVTIRCRGDDKHAILQVIDTGIGIAPEHQQRVFERFYRVDKARSSDLGGTGLGLAIVKHLTQTFGGQIALDSKVGRGSTFEVRLPIAGAKSADLSLCS